MRFSLHDGPGIRTTVFLKGCPLSCWWCHNPESQSPRSEVMYAADRCVSCGDCVQACTHQALTWRNGPVRDADRCTNCGDCAKVCPSDARRLVGQWITADEVVRRARRDQVFFEQSGGGVTFSGGEPLMQPDFLFAALSACKAEGLHTTVDTCGFARPETLVRISEKTDLFLFDVKLIDSERHKHFTGVSNGLILENLAMLVKMKKPVFVRIPIVPGVNDDEANICASMELLSRTGIQKVDLLSYHETGTDKYRRLGSNYGLQDVTPPSPEKMKDLSDRFCREGFAVRIGG
ncbi:MAG TPA: glycyl-radical enzyme activating protein [Terriglobales bacterium]|nr:glycyl-radical enzyme activating protein [Terriglobales bacterium]